MIAAWKLDLNRILHIFNVRSTFHSLVTPLIIHPQTELALHTHVAVSDVRGLVSDIHRVVVKGQDGNDIRNQVVRSHNVYSLLRSSQLPRLKSGSQS